MKLLEDVINHWWEGDQRDCVPGGDPPVVRASVVEEGDVVVDNGKEDKGRKEEPILSRRAHEGRIHFSAGS